MGRVWHPLGRPAFRRLWTGQAVSAVGDQLSVVAVAGLVIGAGHGASGLGLVLAARSLGCRPSCSPTRPAWWSRAAPVLP